MKKHVFLLRELIGGAISLFIAFMVAFPIIWIIFTSLKNNEEMFRIPVAILPTEFYYKNYLDVLGLSKFLGYFFNSFVITVFSTIINIIFSALAAFAFSRFNFKGKTGMLGIVVLTQILPGVTLLIPIYSFWVKFRLINTHLSLIITYAMLNIPLTLWMLVGFFNTVPKEIDSAATIDGCSKMGTLYYILLPLSKPALFASAIYVSLNVWQEFLMASIMTTTEKMRTVMVGLYSFVGEKSTNWGMLMAAAVLISIPVMCFFSLTQKQFANGLAGSVKG